MRIKWLILKPDKFTRGKWDGARGNLVQIEYFINTLSLFILTLVWYSISCEIFNFCILLLYITTQGESFFMPWSMDW